MSQQIKSSLIEPPLIEPPLIALAQQVRETTITLLEHASDDWILWTPSGLSNHMLWHSGHALWLQDHFCIEKLNGEPVLPTGWVRFFGMGSQPATIDQWPDRQQVIQLLKKQLLLMQRLLSENAARLVGPTPESLNRASGIIHGLHDEARHQGEMYLLLKMCRQGATENAQRAR